jgi:hypothetical protein
VSAAPPEIAGRRAAPRVTARLEAAYEDAERQVFLPTRDLSLSGVFLLSPVRPPVGTPASLLLELPEESAFLRLHGAVVRSQAPADGLPGGFALRFEDASLSEQVRRSLAAFLEKRLRSRE